MAGTDHGVYRLIVLHNQQQKPQTENHPRQDFLNDGIDVVLRVHGDPMNLGSVLVPQEAKAEVKGSREDVKNESTSDRTHKVPDIANLEGGMTAMNYL